MRCRHYRQGNGIADCLMKAWIRAAAQHHRQMIGQTKVRNVAHFMMRCQETALINGCAHCDAIILVGAHIP